MSLENKGSMATTVTVSRDPDRSGNFVCNGVADEVEINLALASANPYGGGCVLLLQGTYTLANPITFPGNNLVLQGVGRATFIDGDALTTTNHGIVISGRTDCTVRDLSIQTQDGGTKTCHCIFIEDGSDSFHIENVWIIDSDYDGIHVEGTNINAGWILNCKILGADDDGILVDMDGGHYMDYLHIESCGVADVGNDGIMVNDSRYSEVTNNIIDGSGRYGLAVFSSSLCSIVGNVARVNQNYNIVLAATADCDVVGNVSEYCDRDGIALSTALRNTVTGNIVCSNVEHGITLVNGDNNVIAGNICYENDRGNTGTYDGINIDSNSDDNLILGNTCNDNDRYGISVAGARNRVKENDFSGNTSGAILDSGTDTRIPWFFIPVPNPDAAIGQHQGAEMLDGVDTTVGLEFYVPLEFQELVTVQAVVLQIDDAASGNMVWTVATDYGKICTESYIAQEDTAGATSAITQYELECLDVSDAFTVGPMAAGDLVGFEFTRDGDDGSDTLDEPCYLLGLRLRYV